jgi:hypothetical protein
MIDAEQRGFVTRQQIFDSIKNSSTSKDQAKQFLREMDQVLIKNLETKHIKNINFLV